MARLQTFDRDLQLALADIDPARVNEQLAQFARQSLADVINRKEASSSYTRFVNGVRDAAEETVRVPGAVFYEFSYWGPVLEFLLDYLRKRSPVKSGRYQASHIVMLGSQIVSPDIDIAPDEEVMVVDTQPYARKIEVGHMKMSVGRGVYQDARKAVTGRFGGASGAIQVRFEMVTLPNSYILKGRFRRGFRKYARQKLKADTQAGMPVRYPALVMSMR